jgi:hypothetical protein
MLSELGVQVGFNSNKDISTVISRFEHEGDSFLEITLPQLDDLLTKALEAGRLPSFEGWQTKKGWSHPSFLHGHWMRIFQPNGDISSSPDWRSIRAIRQISRSFKKIFEVCDSHLVDEAIRGFVQTDRELSQLKMPSTLQFAEEISHYLFGSVVGRATSSPGLWKHGPGAVAESFGTNSRWDFLEVSPAIEELVGTDTFRATWSDLRDRPTIVRESCARLIAVPKTAVKPRLISIEPSYNQFIQQGYHTSLKAELGKIRICSYLSQIPNQELAKRGSIDGSLATIDLSEASDRVHYGLVRRLFRWNPAFIEVMDATRSRAVRLPDGTELLLNKFASMGSALTFPVETMVFTVIVALAISLEEGYHTRGQIRSILKRDDVRVYGDDIILPSRYYPTLIRLLTEYGLKVNTSKSFSKGSFRESCGADWWNGHNVTPLYIRRHMPDSKRDTESLTSLVAFRNQWVEKYHYGPTQSYLDELISSIIPFPAGYGGPVKAKDLLKGLNGLVRSGPEDIPQPKWNPHLQRLEVKAMIVKPVKRREVSSDTAKLAKVLMSRESSTPHRIGYPRNVFLGDPIDKSYDHLEYHGRPVAAKLNYRGVAVTLG